MTLHKTYKLFPSPIFHFKIENHKEINIELKNYILDLKKKIIKDKKNLIMEVGTHNFLIKKINL